MGRTLYLNEHNNELRAMRDGPSVWVKAKERAGQRLPARLLGRVVVIGNVRVDAGVITLLAEHNIPVVFMDNRAHETAMVIPYNHKLPAHYEEQKVFLECDEHISRYENWVAAKREIIERDTLKRLCRLPGTVRHGIGEGNYQQIIARLRPASDDQWTTARNFVSNLLRGLIMEHLIKADLDPHVGVLHRRHNFGLVLDMCHIMEAESDMQALQFLKGAKAKGSLDKRNGGWCVTDPGMRDIAHRFENRRPALHRLTESIIDELFELMREINL